MSSIALFPGQGAQVVGMGKDLFENFAIARQVFEEASDACRTNLKKLCFEGTLDGTSGGSGAELNLTENTQPCLLTVSVAAFRVAEAEAGYRPAAVAGHSLGEYSALVAAGALPLAAAARWVKERGAAMQRAVPAGHGTMAAILGLEDEAVQKLCKEATASARTKRSTGETAKDAAGTAVACTVEPVNYNSPGQVVIAGSVDAVNEAIALAKGASPDSGYAGGKAMPLAVSAPFHSSLMRPARDRMAELFAAASGSEKPSSLRCAYVPNRTARLTAEPGVVFELLVDQVDNAVLWKQSVLALIQAGYATGVEFGPGKVLQGLCKRIAPEGMKPLALTGCGDSAAIKALAALAHSPGGPS